MRSILNEFREFALRSSFVEIAIGIFVGAGLTPVANSLIKDLVMPLLGSLIGNVDFSDLFYVLKQGTPIGPYVTADAARNAGAVTLNYGLFINSVFSFLTISWVAFWVLKLINRLKRKTESQGVTKDSSTKVCEHCLTVIPIKAKKCHACTSEVAQIEITQEA